MKKVLDFVQRFDLLPRYELLLAAASLLVRLDFPAVGRECPAKLTVGDLLAAFDLIRQTAVILRHKQHVFAFFAFR